MAAVQESALPSDVKQLNGVLTMAGVALATGRSVEEVSDAGDTRRMHERQVEL